MQYTMFLCFLKTKHKITPSIKGFINEIRDKDILSNFRCIKENNTEENIIDIFNGVVFKTLSNIKYL